jgi:hypothetical protein
MKGQEVEKKPKIRIKVISRTRGHKGLPKPVCESIATSHSII